jgi:hypothetical protein
MSGAVRHGKTAFILMALLVPNMCASAPETSRGGIAESYVINGRHGTGWYHYSTPADQVFGDHGEQINIYVFDFGVIEEGTAIHLGHDLIDTFDAEVDRICFLRTQSRDGGYTVASSVVWKGHGARRTGSSVQITFFAFDVAMNATALGTLSVNYWIAKNGEKLRHSYSTSPFLPAPGCH